MFELLCLQTRAGGGGNLNRRAMMEKRPQQGKERVTSSDRILHKKARSLVSHFFFSQFAFRDYFLFLVLYRKGDLTVRIASSFRFSFLGKYPIVHFRYIAACFPEFFLS